MIMTSGLVSLIMVCTPANSDDITAAPSCAWPQMLDTDMDFKIFWEIVWVFALFRWRKQMRHLLTWGLQGKTSPHILSTQRESPGWHVELCIHQLWQWSVACFLKLFGYPFFGFVSIDVDDQILGGLLVYLVFHLEKRMSLWRMLLPFTKSCSAVMKFPLLVSFLVKSALSVQWPLKGCFARKSTASTIWWIASLFSSACWSCCFNSFYLHIRISKVLLEEISPFCCMVMHCSQFVVEKDAILAKCLRIWHL